MAHFYVYCLFRPWNGEPCYIGKGCGSRAFFHNKQGPRHSNKHLANIYKKAGADLPVVILHSCLIEEIALEYEIILIRAIGRQVHGGPLVNLTDGGDGCPGAIWSEEARQAKAVEVAARWENIEYRAKMSAMNIGNEHAKGMVWSDEARAKRSKLMLGNQHSVGRTWSPEERAVLEAIRKEPNWCAERAKEVTALWDDPEYRAQQMASRQTSEAYKNRHLNRKPRRSLNEEEKITRKQKMVEAGTLGKPLSEEALMKRRQDMDKNGTAKGERYARSSLGGDRN